MDREIIKEKIIAHETRVNGFNHLSGVGVEVKNLKVTKTMAVADVILITDAEAGTSERYNSCEYPLDKI
jgi:hypothetical protein